MVPVNASHSSLQINNANYSSGIEVLTASIILEDNRCEINNISPRNYLQASCISCERISYKTFPTTGSLEQYCQSRVIHVLLALHAWHSWKCLPIQSTPYTVIFGGTDVHCYSKDETQLSQMTRVVLGASHLVAISASLAKKACQLWVSKIDLAFSKNIISSCQTCSLKQHLRFKW